jgi:hypothetical protein
LRHETQKAQAYYGLRAIVLVEEIGFEVRSDRSFFGDGSDRFGGGNWV